MTPTTTRLVLCLLLLATVARAEIIPFDSDRWVLYNAEIVEFDGRQCLIGSAFLPGVAFENGVIEYDLHVDGSRGYPGVRFRASGPGDYETVYLRPHVPNRPDALQYAAAFNGVVGWQLYNGPGCTSAVDIPTGEWIHVRLEVLGARARVFVGEGDAPDLVIDRLRHDAAPGSVAIESARAPSVHYADFAVTKTDDLDFGPEPRPVHLRGLITRWELSQTFAAADRDLETYPGGDLEWTVVEAEPSGLLDIARHRPRRTGGMADLVYARVHLEAEADEIRRFTIGYSDYVCVFLNGAPLFTGDSAYTSRDETFSGIVGLHDTLHLPLQAGRNELVLAVMETFGGWGLMGQDNSLDFAAEGLARRWRLDLGNRLPESALYDPARDLLYVTQYFRGGNEYISRVSIDGEVLDREWATGLSRPTGMVLHDGRLWVVDRRNLSEIDTGTGEVLARHAIPGARFPNDVAFDDAGRAYVSDTFGSCLHRWDGETWEVWLQGEMIGRPNALFWDDGRMLYGNQDDGCLKAVNPDDRTVNVVASLGDDSNVDGIRPDGRGGYVVSDFRGRVYRVRDGAVETLLDTTASGGLCADLEYVPDKGLLVVPGLYDNRLTAYTLAD